MDSSGRCWHCGRKPCRCDTSGELLTANPAVEAEPEVAVVSKGKARAGRYTTPTAPPDPWMQRRREPWRGRKGRRP